MSAFEEFWNVEEDSDGDYENMKHFAKTYWDAAIKFKEAGEQRPTKQSLPCRWCGYPLNAKLQCINGSCDHCGE